MIRMALWTFVAVLAAALVRPVVAQPPKPDMIWAVPDSAVAYIAFDGTSLGAEANRARALVAAAVRGLLSNVVMVENGSAVANEVLRARALGSAPWRACLLELEGESKDIKRGPRLSERIVRPSKFGAVIEVFASRNEDGHDRLLAAIEAGLARDSSLDRSPRQRTALRLGDGATGGLSSADEPWRDVAWVSRPGSLIVAFGRGTIEKYPGRSRGGAWGEHRRAISDARGTSVLEAFVDLNALRRGVPDEFDGGGLDRLVHAWRIANHRAVMLHGRLIGEPEAGARVLTLRTTWSSRAEAPGTVRAAAISESTWPEALGERPKDAWVVALRPDVGAWLNFGLDTYQALGPTEFEAIRSRWERRAAQFLDRVLPRIGEWMLVKPGLEVGIAVRPVAGNDRLDADLRGVFSNLQPTVRTGRRGWELVEPAAEQELQGFVWRLDSGTLFATWEPK